MQDIEQSVALRDKLNKMKADDDNNASLKSFYAYYDFLNSCFRNNFQILIDIE